MHADMWFAEQQNASEGREQRAYGTRSHCASTSVTALDCTPVIAASVGLARVGAVGAQQPLAWGGTAGQAGQGRALLAPHTWLQPTECPAAEKPASKSSGAQSGACIASSF